MMPRKPPMRALVNLAPRQAKLVAEHMAAVVFEARGEPKDITLTQAQLRSILRACCLVYGERVAKERK